MIRLYTSLIIIAIITVLVYVFFILPQPDYTRTLTLMVIPQKTHIAAYADTALNDIVFIAQNVADGNETRITRDAEVKIDREKDHNLFTIKTKAHSPKDVRAVERHVVKNIYTQLNRYYVLGSDMRIQSVSTTDIYKTPLVVAAPYVVMVVVAIGLIAGVFALFHTMEKPPKLQITKQDIDGKRIFERYRMESRVPMTGEISPSFERKEEIVEEKRESVEKEEINNEEENITEKKAQKTKNEKNVIKDDAQKEKDLAQIVSTTAKSATVPSNLPTTPGNLPVVDISDFGFGASNEEENNEEIIDDIESDPTEEELKARLNELLDGKL